MNKCSKLLMRINFICDNFYVPNRMSISNYAKISDAFWKEQMKLYKECISLIPQKHKFIKKFLKGA